MIVSIPWPTDGTLARFVNTKQSCSRMCSSFSCCSSPPAGTTVFLHRVWGSLSFLSIGKGVLYCLLKFVSRIHKTPYTSSRPATGGRLIIPFDPGQGHSEHASLKVKCLPSLGFFRSLPISQELKRSTSRMVPSLDRSPGFRDASQEESVKDVVETLFGEPFV
jgi:hypothetical protein